MNLKEEKVKAWNIYRVDLGHTKADARKTFRTGFDAGVLAERERLKNLGHLSANGEFIVIPAEELFPNEGEG